MKIGYGDDSINLKMPRKFNRCVDKCVCSPFCLILERDAFFDFSECYPQCVMAKPSSTNDFAKFINNFALEEENPF